MYSRHPLETDVQTIVQTVSIVLAGRLQGEGSRPLRQYKSQPLQHPHRRALQRVNIILSGIAPRDSDRYALASAVFNRHIESTYDLTVAECLGFLSVAHPEGGIEVHPKFNQYLYDTLEKISHESD
jgi:hypothetical protein